jgi:hypothetical protein
MNYVIYRISSNSQNKDRIQNFNKIDLLVRAIQIFSSFHFIIVADNCNSQLLNKIKTLGQEVIITNLGNAGSAFFCLNYALLRGSVDSIFYFCEDDYFHKEGSDSALIGGLKYFDYISLFNNPDKYSGFSVYHAPGNTGKFSETSEIIYTEDPEIIWKTSSSTTLTFGVSFEILKEDIDLFNCYFNFKKIPPDLYIWQSLVKSKYKAIGFKQKLFFYISFIIGIKFKKRYLGIPLHSFSFHLENNFKPPLFNYES